MSITNRAIKMCRNIYQSKYTFLQIYFFKSLFKVFGKQLFQIYLIIWIQNGFCFALFCLNNLTKEKLFRSKSRNHRLCQNPYTVKKNVAIMYNQHHLPEHDIHTLDIHTPYFSKQHHSHQNHLKCFQALIPRTHIRSSKSCLWNQNLRI